ncbi:hypothetical protein Echvi_2054 [Echinicola vietnamensis DSM 17526]|uniref:Uncharacterized protein n=1 Tax=Echinicola vietnamensis (strain DSM 17526 / LMG 23754 / KMM 6221) TaxID=926556 RepID=L0FZW9_ECHVK|nr:hypothetical protein Echvi_2054 [Echinicola vietnamensis DSM 17526]
MTLTILNMLLCVFSGVFSLIFSNCLTKVKPYFETYNILFLFLK